MIKQGLLDYKSVVAPALEGLMGEIEELAQKSTLPDKVDRAYWDQFVIDTVSMYVL